MNPAPDQPPSTTVNTIPTVGSTTNPVIPIPNPPASSVPPINNPSPPPPPPAIVSSPPPPHKKFPFMMVTLFLAIALAGFAGSLLFFSYNGNKSTKVPAKILITPPVSAAPTETVTNPFATASGDLGSNPFASPTAILNPFGTYQNPFATATPSGTQTYQNPF